MKYRPGIPADAIITDGTNGPGYGDAPGAPSSTDNYYGGKLIAESMDGETRRRLIALLNAFDGIDTERIERLQPGELIEAPFGQAIEWVGGGQTSESPSASSSGGDR